MHRRRGAGGGLGGLGDGAGTGVKQIGVEAAARSTLVIGATCAG